MSSLTASFRRVASTTSDSVGQVVHFESGYFDLPPHNYVSLMYSQHTEHLLLFLYAGINPPNTPLNMVAIAPLGACLKKAGDHHQRSHPNDPVSNNVAGRCSSTSFFIAKKGNNETPESTAAVTDETKLEAAAV